jgi:formylglycine-generating enzyme required for sulfatase activity
MLRIAGGAVVPPFLIDRQEVTVEQYRACMRANACTAPDRAPLCTFGEFARGGYPVNCVSQSQAADYCHCAGKRLPTDDEWEYLLVHYGASARAEPRSPVRADVGPAPAGSYLAASGLADLVGNVWQWSASPAGMSWGGSWDSEPVYVRDYSQLRNPVQPGWKLPTMGFRCAAER